jgi:hypothetical protein
MRSFLSIKLRVCWWLGPAADAVMALRAWRIFSDSIATRLLMILLRHGVRLDSDEPVARERRHG